MPDVLTRRNFLSFDFGDRRAPGDHWVRIHRIAMACRFEILLSSEDAASVASARAALDDADAIESVLTVFRDTSDVADLNRRAAGQDVAVDAALFDLLVRCHELHGATDGAFDVTSTPLSRCWGFLMRQGRLPAHDVLREARDKVGSAHVRLDPVRRTVRFARPGVELNFGAIGKGYALDRMASMLRADGVRRALLSAGRSSVVAIGGRGRGWPIDVRPRLASRLVGRLLLRDGAVGTSGAGEQSFEIDGQRYGHVIDPRTGRPAAGVLGSTVVAGDGAAADALSTAFLIGGPALAERYCAAHPETMAVLVLEDEPERARIFGSYHGVTLEMES